MTKTEIQILFFEFILINYFAEFLKNKKKSSLISKQLVNLNGGASMKKRKKTAQAIFHFINYNILCKWF